MKRLIPFLFFASAVFAQQPQAPQGTPPFDVNARYTSGVGVGYAPTKDLTGLTLHLAGGTVVCSGTTPTFYAGGTLAMTNSTTNYVYLNISGCAPASNTSGFTSSTIPIAIVVTAGGNITTLTDVRSLFNSGTGGGGGGGSPGGSTTDCQSNQSGSFYGDEGCTYDAATQSIGGQSGFLITPSQAAAFAAPTVTVNVTGSTGYTYTVVAYKGNIPIAISAQTSITNGAALGTISNGISWSAVLSADHYVVWRFENPAVLFDPPTATRGIVATVAAPTVTATDNVASATGPYQPSYEAVGGTGITNPLILGDIYYNSMNRFWSGDNLAASPSVQIYQNQRGAPAVFVLTQNDLAGQFLSFADANVNGTALQGSNLYTGSLASSGILTGVVGSSGTLGTGSLVEADAANFSIDNENSGQVARANSAVLGSPLIVSPATPSTTTEQNGLRIQDQSVNGITSHAIHLEAQVNAGTGFEPFCVDGNISGTACLVFPQSAGGKVTIPPGSGTLCFTSTCTGAVTSVFGRAGAVVAATNDYTQTQIASGAIANGSTATTQTVGDNTTKVATDAFVIANAGSGGTPGGATNTIQYNNAGAFGGIALPTTVAGLTYTFTSTGGLGAWGIQGRPTTAAQTGVYTFNGAGAAGTGASADQGLMILANPSAARVYTLPQAGTTGFANAPFWALFNENASFGITLTPTTSTVNGTTTALVPPLGFSIIGTDSTNANYIAATVPTLNSSGFVPCSFAYALTGDATSSAGSCATTVVQVEGAAIPTSATLLGTNSSKQLIAAALASADIFVGNGSNLPVAVALTGDSSITNAGAITNKAINGVAFSGLASGLVFNTTTTGVPSIATSAQILAACTGCAPLASPTFTGTPAAPTATAGTNTTQIATTAFVLANSTLLSGLTTGFFPKASSASTIANSLCDEGITTANTMTCTDTSGIVAPKFVSSGTTAGFIDFPQGSTSAAVAPCNTATSICEQAPTAVTSYLVVKPGVAANGVVTNNVASAVDTQGFSGDANHSATVTIGSGTSIGSTALCSSGNCPAGTYEVSAYLDITTACGTTGTYVVSLIYTDDQGSKTAVINFNGTGAVPATGIVTTTSTANFGQETQVLRLASGAINYSTTAVACGSAGPMVGKLYLSVTPKQ